MVKVAKRVSLFVLAILLAFSTMLTGCESKDSSSSTSGALKNTSGDLKKVTLKIILFGDKKSATDQVFSEISKEYKNQLNCDFNVTFLPGTDYATKLVAMAASGDNWDLCFDGNWLSFSQMVNNKAYADVIPLLKKDAPNLYKQYQSSGVLSAVTIGGKAYALPWTMTMNQRPYLQWNKQDADSAGIYNKDGGIQSLEDMDTFFAAMHKAFPAKKLSDITNQDLFLAKYQYGKIGDYVWSYSLNDAKPKIQCYYMTDAYMEQAQWSKKWQDAGYIWKDVLTNAGVDHNDLKHQGDLITVISTHEWVNALDLFGTTTPGGAAGSGKNENRYYSEMYPDNKFENRTPLANLIAINANAANPDRAMKFMELNCTDQKFYDLLQYGIQGTTYTLGSDGAANYPSGMTTSNSNYMEWGGQWGFWNPNFMRPTATYPKDFWKNEATFAKQSNNVTSVLTAFMPDTSSVANEMTAVTAVIGKYDKPIRAGLVNNYQSEVNSFRNDLKSAGIDKITAAIQKQADAYLASK